MLAVLRVRRFHAALVAAVAVPSLAFAAVVTRAPATTAAAADTGNGVIRVIAHPPGSYVLFDTVLGRTMVVADPTAPQPQAGAHASDQPSPATPNQAMPEHEMVGGWDSWIANLRRSIYYPEVTPYQGAGAITTIAGGLCDGLPGPDVTVDPGNVVADAKGRLFWLDLGWTAHLAGAPYIRELDTDGRVRTLGTVDGPAEGRLIRDMGAADGMVRLVPDQQGGVYYSYGMGILAGTELQTDATNESDDLPVWGVIGHLHADGAAEFVSGVTGRMGFTYDLPDQRHDGGPYASASFGDIEAMAMDTAGNLLAVDGNGYFAGSAYATGRRSPGTTTVTYNDSPSPTGLNQRLLRYLNRSDHDVTFYPGTSSQMTVAAGQVGTIAGPPQGTPRTQPGLLGNPAQSSYQGLQDPTPGSPVPAPKADLGFPTGMVVDGNGNIVLLEYDSDDSTIKLLGINTGSSPVTMYGTSVPPGDVADLGSHANGYAGDGGSVKSAAFDVDNQNGWLYGDITRTADGALYVADTFNNRVRRIAPDGTVSTVIGNGAAVFNGDGLAPATTSIAYPMGVAVLPSGTLVVSDWHNSEIRALERDGRVHDLAGRNLLGSCGADLPASTWAAERAGTAKPDGPARIPSYNALPGVGTPRDAVEDSRGNIYMADPDLGVVRRMTPDGRVSVIAGQERLCSSTPPSVWGVPADCATPQDSGDGGSPLAAVLQQPSYLLVDRWNNLYVSSPDAIRYINLGDRTRLVHGHSVLPGTIATVMSSNAQTVVTPLSQVLPVGGDHCGTASVCGLSISSLVGLGEMALDDSGTLYVSNHQARSVMSVDWCGNVSVVAGGDPDAFVNGFNGLNGNDGDGGPALAAAISPSGLALDQRRHLLYIADTAVSYSVGVSAAPGSWGTGAGEGFSGSGRIRVVNLGNSTQEVYGRPLPAGFIDTAAGDGQCSSGGWPCTNGDGGSAYSATVGFPMDVQLAPDGRLFIAETQNRIRVVDNNGIIHTIAGVTPDYSGTGGVGSWFFSVGGECGDGGVAYAACLGGTAGMKLTPKGDLLLPDFETGRLRLVSDALHAPYRPLAVPPPGAGWQFTQPQALVDPGGHEMLDPSIVYDAGGAAEVMAVDQAPDGSLTFTPPPVGCALFHYRPNADGQGHDLASFAGIPDRLTSVNVPVYGPLIGKGACSLTVAPPGASSYPPLGSADRLSYATGSPYGSKTVVSGASRDGGNTFLSSPVGVLPPSSNNIAPMVTAESPDTTDLVMDAQEDVNGQGVTVIAFAQSQGGVEYAYQSPAFVYAFPYVGQPQVPFNSAVLSSDHIFVPVVANTCVGAGDPVNGCTSGAVDSQLLVASRKRSDTTWTTSAPLFSYPCTRKQADGQAVWVPNPWCFNDHGRPQIAVDSSGTVYAVWDNSQHAYIAHSKDGISWSTPRQIDGDGLTLAGFPTLVAGDKGRVAVAYYGTTDRSRDLSSPWSRWQVYLSVAGDADSDTPHFEQSPATRQQVVSGALCQPCPYESNQGSGAGTFFRLAMSPLDGRVTIAFNESAGLAGNGKFTSVLLTRQCTGPSLLAKPTGQVPCATDALPTATQPPPSSLACPQQGHDPPGDDAWHGLTPANLDITDFGVMRASDAMRVDIGVRSFSSTPPVPSDGSLPATGMTWTGFWRSGAFTYWAQASTPNLLQGTAPGIAYSWGVVTDSGGLAPVGSAAGEVSGDHIVIEVPADATGDPQPGTVISGLHARTDVLTGATPETYSVSPQAQDDTVDVLSTTVGYDPRLSCTVPADAAAPTPPAAPLPVPVPSVSLPALPVTPGDGLPLPVPQPTLPVTAGVRRAAAPDTGVLPVDTPTPAPLATAEPSVPPVAARLAPAVQRATDPSWAWRLIHETPPTAQEQVAAASAAQQQASAAAAAWRGAAAPSGRPPSQTVKQLAAVPQVCARVPPPPDEPAGPPSPPPLVPGGLPSGGRGGPPPPEPPAEPPIVEPAPGPGPAPVSQPAPAPAQAPAAQQGVQQVQQTSIQGALAPQEQEQPQVALQRQAQEVAEREQDAMVAQPESTPTRMWEMVAGAMTIGVGMALALARSCVALATVEERRERRRRRRVER